MLKEFEQIVGQQMSLSFIRFLEEIGPDARTQRISIVIAAVLKYALDLLPAHCEEGSLGEALLVISEEPYLVNEQSEEVARLEELIDTLCEKAGMQNSVRPPKECHTQLLREQSQNLRTGMPCRGKIMSEIYLVPDR